MKETKLDVQEISKDYEGYVVVEVLKFRDRVKYGQELKFKTENGEVVVDGDLMATTLKMIDLTEKHFKKVEVKHLESGEVASSFEELEGNPDFDNILPSLCGAILNAGRVGKS